MFQAVKAESARQTRAVWRDLMPGADLDKEAAKSAAFVKKTLV